jgi:PAS domain-containing protein
LSGEFENCVVRKDGSYTVLEWTSTPVVEDRLMYALAGDVTERGQAESEFGRLAAEQVDDIFDLSLDLLCVASLDGYFHRVNPAFERTLGYDAAELLSRPLLELVHRDDRTRTAEVIAGLAERRHVSGFENRCIRADGAVR